jgi:hypothetical protein
VLGRSEVDVLEAERRQAEFLDHRRGSEGQVVTVADVDRGPGELLARSGAPDVGAGLDQQRRHAGPSEIGRRDESVVSGTDHDGVVVGGGAGRSGRHGPQSLVVRAAGP